MTSEASRSAISSPEAASGASPPDSPDGQTTGRSGPARARASRSVSREKVKAPTILGTCGPTSFASSESVDRPLWLENRCPTPQAPEGQSTKTCSRCGQEKTFSEFYRTRGKHASSSGLHAQCKTCCREWQANYRTGSKAQRSGSFQKYREKNRALVLVTAARYRAKQAGLAFDLDQFADQLQARIDAGRCELSGLPFRLDGGRTWDSPSLDRIIPELGYTITNVRVVLFALNVMMNTWGEEPVLKVADGIKELRASAQEHPLAKWEARLKERLSKVGSTEFPLTWSQSVTPSGRPISRLAPSMRRTSDSGSIGWPTPCVPNGGRRPRGGAMSLTGQTPDGMKRQVDLHFVARHILTEGGGNAHLPIQARESASWPTPTSRDGKDGSYTPNVPLNGLLGRMVWATPRATDGEKGGPGMQFGRGTGLPLPAQAFGTTQNSASAQTEKRGALNPEFVFWLMGFPAEWVSCALAAMQSFRRSQQKSSRRSSTPKTLDLTCLREGVFG